MKICRVCLEEETEDNPIVQRCDCKECLIHDSCLEEWIMKKKNLKCEICLSEFKNVNVLYEFKKDKDIFRTMLPLLNSLFVIFMTMSFFIMNDTKNEYETKEQKIKKINTTGFLMYILFCNLVYENPNKLFMEMKSISFNPKINENKLV